MSAPEITVSNTLARAEGSASQSRLLGRLLATCICVSSGWSADSTGTTTRARTTYYVAMTGADTNSGTATSPFRSIQKAANSVAPGDTVIVRPGVYRENVVMKTSGAPGRPIVFSGERGSGGEWQTIVEPGVPVSGWVPAPEVGPGVYKNTDLGFVPRCMILDGKQLARIRDDFMATGKLTSEIKGYSAAWWISRFRETTFHEEPVGFGLLRMPADTVVAVLNDGYKIPYWDGVEALYGHRNGATFVRFRNGDDPNGMKLSAAAGGGAFLLKSVGHVVIRGFLVRGAEDAIVITGDGANHNVVDANFLTNGRSRVLIEDAASFNIVQGNSMTLNYHGFGDPGAWTSNRKTHRTAIRQHVYLQFKFTVGRNSSDDVGVAVRGGEGNIVRGNHIFGGLGGVKCRQTRNVRVHDNIIRNMSSIGIATMEGVVGGQFHDNLVYDCNINLRIHHYNNKGDMERSEYYYRNRLYLPEGLGSQIFNHWWTGGIPPDSRHPEIFIYHNSIAGGGKGMSPSGYASRGGGMARTHLFNNIFSSAVPLSVDKAFSNGRAMFAACDYNWVGGTLSHGVPAWFGERNVYAQGKRIWAPDEFPDFTLSADSPARGRGLDLSKPFVFDGKTHDPLPGMKVGYFRGAAPDLGALQYGEKAPLVSPIPGTAR